MSVANVSSQSTSFPALTKDEIIASATLRLSRNAHSSIRIALTDASASPDESAGSDFRALYIDPFRFVNPDAASDQPSDQTSAHDAAVIFFTHDHYDHFSPQDFAGLMNNETIFVMPASMRAQAIEACPDLASHEILALEPNDSGIITIGDSATTTASSIAPSSADSQAAASLKATSSADSQATASLEATSSAVQASPVTIIIDAVASYNINKKFHPKSNNWLGYIVTLDGVRYYIAGDTDATPELTSVNADVVLLPVGGTYTMTAAEAAAATNAMRDAQNNPVPTLAIPTHYGSITGTPDDGAAFIAAVDPDIKTLLI